MLTLDPETWTMQGVLRAFFVVGAVLAGSGLLWTANTVLFLCRAEKTTGVVVDVVAIQSTRSPGESPQTKQVTSYYPVVEFRDSQGLVQRSQSSRAAQSDHLQRGDKVGVYYDPKNPAQMFIQNPWMLWFSPGVLLGSGLIWMLFVAGAMILARRFDVGFAQDKARFFGQVKATNKVQRDLVK
jgi:hypothetical protein